MSNQGEWLLERNVQHLQFVLDRASLGTFEHHLGSATVRMSPLACKLYGVPVREEVPLCELVGRIHPDDTAGRELAFRRVVDDATADLYDVQYRVGPPDFPRWLHVRGRVVYRDSVPTQVVGIVSDITEHKSRERRFENMRAMLEAIGQSTDAFIYAKDAAGRMLYCNDAVLNVLGRPRAEVIGHTDAEFLGPGPATEAIVAHDAQVIRDGRPLVFTEQLAPVGKSFLSTKTPFRDAAGELVGLAGVSIDITELERTRQALAEIEERTALAAKAAELGVYDWDPRSNKLVWSDALREQFGVDLGQEVTLETALERIHPEDRARVEKEVQAALDPAGDGRYDVQYRTQPVRGETRWLHVLGRVRFEKSGGRIEAARFSGVSVNITRQKELEQAWRFQQHLTQIITDNATTAILMMDEGGHCTFMNPAAERMTGFSFEEVRGGRLHDFIHHLHPDGRPYPVDECPIDRALPEQFDVVAHEDTFVRKDGSFFPVVVNARPIRKDGAAIGTVIEVRDVTQERESLRQLRLMSEKLAEADRRKDDFLATLAHELRNPLSPIRTASSLLATGQLGAERLGWAGQVIQRQVEHMSKLLDDLLDVARITRGKITIEPQPTSVRELVETAVEAVRPLIDERRHSLQIGIPSGSVEVLVDRYRISQVLINLLTNAARYTPQGGHIAVSARTTGSDLAFVVSDDGVGLEADEVERVFEMFAQGRAGTSGTSHGLGVGLALSQALARLHGGELRASSAGAGKGSSFELLLPDTVLTARASHSQAAVPLAAAPKRVLIADDNRDAADSLAMMLQLHGHDVRAVYGGRDALAAARDMRPQVVVLDIGMPDMSGYDVAQALRTQPWAGDALFVALTGWGQASDRQQAADAGFHEHLTKPADSALLLALLARGTRAASEPLVT